MRSNINSSREYSTMNLEQLLSYNNFTDYIQLNRVTQLSIHPYILRT